VNPLRIAITGTHSTGKSTFCSATSEALKKAGFRVSKVADLATKAREHGFPILHNHTYESTLWIISQGIADELAAGLNVDVVVIDRGVPDALGYWLAALEHRNEQPRAAELHRIESIVRMYTTTYDLLFNTVLDPNIPLGTNQERDKDNTFRLAAAHHIEQTIRGIGARPITLINGSVQSAVDLVLALAHHRRASEPKSSEVEEIES
jgi:predicted ATPase